MGTAVGEGVAVGFGEGMILASDISGVGVDSAIGAISGVETVVLSVPQEVRIMVLSKVRKTTF